MVNLELDNPMPLYVNLSRVSLFDSRGLMLLLKLLERLQSRFSYIKFVDFSEKMNVALWQLEAPKALGPHVLDHPQQPVSSIA